MLTELNASRKKSFSAKISQRTGVRINAWMSRKSTDLNNVNYRIWSYNEQQEQLRLSLTIKMISRQITGNLFR